MIFKMEFTTVCLAMVFFLFRSCASQVGRPVPSSSTRSSSTLNNPFPSGSGSTTSLGSSVFGGGGEQQSGSSSGGSTSSGGTAMAKYPVPYDMKSLANPHWVSFLEEVATQTSRKLADLRLNGVNDPIIGHMWNTYVQTLSEGPALPAIAVGGAGEGPVNAFYDGGAHVVGATGSFNAPGNWFRSFFTDPADKVVGNNMFNSFMQMDKTSPAGSIDSNQGSSSLGSSVPLTAASGQSGTYDSVGPSYLAQSRSLPATKSISMEQMFSQFRTGSSSPQKHQSLHRHPQYQKQATFQQYQQQRVYNQPPRQQFSRQHYQYQQQQQRHRPARYQHQNRYQQQQHKGYHYQERPQNRRAPSQQRYQQRPMNGAKNGRNIGQRFYSPMSPLMTKSVSSQQASRGPQPAFTARALYRPNAAVPDMGFGTGRSARPKPIHTRQEPTVPQASNALPRLSSATMRQLSDELMRLLHKTVITPKASASPSLTPSSFSPTPNQPPRTALSHQNYQGVHFSTSKAKRPTPPQHPFLQNIKSLTASTGYTTSFSNDPFSTALKPEARFYDARTSGRASQNRGCKTLGEMVDMDIPRPMDLNCNRLCPAVIPGAVQGRRFGRTCLCCPVNAVHSGGHQDMPLQ